MVTEKPTMEWLNEMIKDEEKGKNEYEKYGFFNLAKDEARHKEALEKVLRTEYGQKGQRLGIFGRKLI
jgi:rubrerythrin